MNASAKVIPYPSPQECSPSAGHTLYAGGMNMKVTHQHPKYTSEKERLDRLQALKKACAIKIHGLHSGARTA